jgi:hypothetical protein
VPRKISRSGKLAWLISGGVLLCVAQCLLLLPEMPNALDTRHLKWWNSLEWWYRPVESNRFLRLPRVTEDLNSVFFLPNTEIGWIVGNAGSIIHTANGGETWEAQKSPVKAHLESVSFLDRNNGWAVGTKGTVLRTRDGGINGIPFRTCRPPRTSQRSLGRIPTTVGSVVTSCTTRPMAGKRGRLWHLALYPKVKS